ncbi:hypothetical protein BDA96_03G263300 [Sorghum bicolor]|uniref:Uncharacterized protein n=1 Tax=Sorghum bicolor TaxID=4558 RepID=A0A921UNX2_SORBI|nr:hypothetical protein BDA96_03G263300 [Sorghum bicolor]
MESFASLHSIIGTNTCCSQWHEGHLLPAPPGCRAFHQTPSGHYRRKLLVHLNCR